MKRHIQDFSQYIRESMGQRGSHQDSPWILYYWENYVPHFLSAHGSEQEAEKAWYEAIDDRFGDEITGWVEANLPRGIMSPDDLGDEEYKRLYKQGIEWASDELAYELEFSYDRLEEIMQRDDYRTELYDQFRQEMEGHMPRG